MEEGQLKRPTMFMVAGVMLFLVAMGNAPAENRTLEFWGLFKPDFAEWTANNALFSPQTAVIIEWGIRNARGNEKVNIAWMKNGVFKKYLAQNQSCGFQPINGVLVGSGHINWFPLPSEVGCENTVRITTTDNALSNLSHQFKIYPASDYRKDGVKSYAKLDNLLSGERLLLGREFKIRFTVVTSALHWPTRKLNILLMANINGNLTEVGRIHTYYVAFAGCHIFNEYKWYIGELKSVTDASKKPTGTNDIKYRIRLDGDEGYYDSEDFTIVKLKVGMKGILK